MTTVFSVVHSGLSNLKQQSAGGYHVQVAQGHGMQIGVIVTDQTFLSMFMIWCFNPWYNLCNCSLLLLTFYLHSCWEKPRTLKLVYKNSPECRKMKCLTALDLWSLGIGPLARCPLFFTLKVAPLAESHSELCKANRSSRLCVNIAYSRFKHKCIFKTKI